MATPRFLLSGLLTSPSLALSEGEITRLWRYLFPLVDQLETESGERVEVISPGRVNGFSGPDLKGTEIRIGGIVRKGAVEIHRQPADWYHHAHHHDPAYNRVILHLCLRADGHCPTRRKDNKFVPLLVVGNHLPEIERICDLLRVEEGELSRRLAAVKRPCYRNCACQKAGEFGRSLEQFGKCWLIYRACELGKLRQERRVWQSMVEALGYTANHRQFRALARRMKAAEFYRRVFNAGRRVDRESWLLGRGGWLERPFGRQVNRSIYRRRKNWEKNYPDCDSLVDFRNWNRRGVRPHSYPQRRWLIFAEATGRMKKKWRDWFLDFEKGLKIKRIRRAVREQLEPYFFFSPGSYWKYHYTCSDKKHAPVPRPVGKFWYDQLTLNVILPWLYYRALHNKNSFSTGELEELFVDYPPILKNHRTEKIVRQAGKSEFKWRNILQQQGAVFLYKVKCEQGKCESCPLADYLARKPEMKLKVR